MNTWLITGGTGSLGQALTTELLKRDDIHAIRIYSRSEYAQWQMQGTFKDGRLRFLIGDVRDKARLGMAMRGVDFAVHAAALKQIDTAERNPQEFIRTNCEGAVNVVETAVQVGVKKVLGISSDKAVYPTGLYGATKLILETLFKDANRYSLPRTAFACFRCGNYWHSHGNVFELWERQAVNDGVCTLTDEKMKRYFIDTQDAARSALQCLHDMEGGEIFFPHMTEYNMLELLKERHPQVAIKIIGLRDAERSREPLWRDDEVDKMHEGEGYTYIK